MITQVVNLGALVRVSHSVFALPFALVVLLVVMRHRAVSIEELTLLVAAVVTARTAAMAFNRLADAEFDRANPRTADREIPRGAVSKLEAFTLMIFSVAAFLFCAAALGSHCLLLTPFVVLVVLGYSLVKRVSGLSHFVLGAALACAPGGVWYALMGTFDPRIMVFMTAVAAWVAGFDILYACSDVEFDRKAGLHSLPARVGVSRAVTISIVLQSVAALLLLVFGQIINLGFWYYTGTVCFTMLLAAEQLRTRQEGAVTAGPRALIGNAAASFVFLLGCMLEML